MTIIQLFEEMDRNSWKIIRKMENSLETEKNIYQQVDPISIIIQFIPRRIQLRDKKVWLLFIIVL